MSNNKPSIGSCEVQSVSVVLADAVEKNAEIQAPKAVKKTPSRIEIEIEFDLREIDKERGSRVFLLTCI